ncbi:MAG: adenosylmethionine--8-amino-7-oxononanoate transaminase [Planctomycetota bacterium]
MTAREESLAARDRRTVWHPYTQHGVDDEPLAVESARGALLRLADGREILDAISSWWTCLHGHGRPEIQAAIAHQARTLDHVLFAGATHEPAVAVAEELLRVAPKGLARVFYSDDGSTAVEVALKIAFQSFLHRGESQRTVFVALEGGYHGDTFGAMAAGDPDPFFEPFRPLLFRVARARVDAQSVSDTLDELGDRAAGVIVEPLVQGAGGMRMHTPQFLRDVRALCDRHHVPLIADEVMTGFGRTGALFACEVAGVVPDLMCVAKGLTGGVLPLAATLATEALFEAFLSQDRGRAFFHGHSFTANPIACAAALASLDIVRRENTPTKLAAIGATIEAELRRAIPSSLAVREVRRTGGIVALELDTREKGYLALDALRMRKVAIEHGVLLRPLGNVVYALPPACTTESEARVIARAMVATAAAAVR